MAAFTPLNQIVWRDYTSIIGGLVKNVAENELKRAEMIGQCGITTCTNSSSRRHGKRRSRGEQRSSTDFDTESKMQGNKKQCQYLQRVPL